MLAKVKLFLKSVRNLTYDGMRYLRQSSVLAKPGDEGSLLAHIKMDSHRIEKGLALPQPRPGFGTEVIDRLIANIQRFEQQHPSHECIPSADRALLEYRDFCPANGIQNATLEEFLKQRGNQGNGGSVELHAAEILEATKFNFQQFAHARRSVRQFSDEPVDPGKITAAVRAAERTPSVCNRQSARAYRIATPELKAALLEVQGGNRGFTEQIAELVIVTTELKNFVSAAERYQGWIDGGLFAMSLVYGLHSQGLATCMLNWSVDPSRDRTARKLMNLSDSENIIVFIAVGNYPATFRVAASPRFRTDDLLKVL